MQLLDLFLDRFLYRQKQTTSTQGAEDVAVNNAQPPSNALASGNSVTDINSNAQTVNGGNITPGTLPGPDDIANWGWTQTCVFTSIDADTVSWSAGTFTSAQGVSYAISGGTTGNMGATTYVYLDSLAAPTVYTQSNTITAPIGPGKVLVAVCKNASVGNATYNLVQATQIVADNILANTILANKLSVSQLSAISANIGAITAGTIDGVIITGGTVRTSSGGTRVEMASATNDLRVYSAAVLRMSLATDTMTFYNTAGVLVGQIFADGSDDFSIKSNSSLGVGRNLLLFCGQLQHLILGDNAVQFINAVQGSIEVLSAKYQFNDNRFTTASNNSLDLGGVGTQWRSLYIGTSLVLNGTTYTSFGTGDAVLANNQTFTGTNTFTKSTGSGGIAVNFMTAQGSNPDIGQSGTPFRNVFTTNLSVSGGIIVHGAVSSTLPAISGTLKNAIVPTSEGYRALACMESPEVWFMDFTPMVDVLDPLFRETTEGPYRYIKCEDGWFQVWGRRKGYKETRFEMKTEKEFIANERFLNMNRPIISE